MNTISDLFSATSRSDLHTAKTSPRAGPLEMELGGLEPPTSWVRSRRSPS
jgi:hypothetical protein